MRQGLTEVGAGLPLDFNYVESVDIFKGAPTVLSGVSQNVGVGHFSTPNNHSLTLGTDP
jgi:hypothetical protein